MSDRFIWEEGDVVIEWPDEEAKGGPGSGNWRHLGRPGHRGGSQGGGGHNMLAQSYGVTPRGAETPQSTIVKGRALDIDNDLPHLAKMTETDIRFQAKSTGSADNVLKDIVVAQGFDGPSDVVSEAELDAYIAGGETEIFRGTLLSRDDKYGLSPVDMMDPDIMGKIPNSYNAQFKDGDFFIGVGIYGNGVYSSTKYNTAAMYVERATDNHIMRMTIKKGARVIDYADAEDLQRKKSASFDTRAPEREARLLKAAAGGAPELRRVLAEVRAEEAAEDSSFRAKKSILSDVGRVAALDGFDAIRVPQTGDTEDYYVILNRTATRVQR
jgi:hypothetical protein